VCTPGEWQSRVKGMTRIGETTYLKVNAAQVVHIDDRAFEVSGLPEEVFGNEVVINSLMYCVAVLEMGCVGVM